MAGPGGVTLPTAASRRDQVSITSKSAGWPLRVPLTVIVIGPRGERLTDSPGVVTKYGVETKTGLVRTTWA
jgi:hypothetical protein